MIGRIVVPDPNPRDYDDGVWDDALRVLKRECRGAVDEWRRHRALAALAAMDHEPASLALEGLCALGMFRRAPGYLQPATYATASQLGVDYAYEWLDICAHEDRQQPTASEAARSAYPVVL